MTPDQGKKALAKLFGKTCGWRVDEHAPKAAERELAREQLPALTAAARAAIDAREARRLELLRDPEFNALCAVAVAAIKAREDCGGITRHFRVTVGHTLHGLAFVVKGEGDTWHEAVEAARAKVGK